MGIDVFGDEPKYIEMTRELNRAQAKDRKAERQSENGADHLRILLSGSDAHDPRKTELYPRLQNYIPWLRDIFSKHVICRTLDSVDYQGQKIFGMAPYHEHVMLLELREWEKKALSALVNKTLEYTPLTTLVGTGKVRFHIFLRRVMPALLQRWNLGLANRVHLFRSGSMLSDLSLGCTLH